MKESELLDLVRIKFSEISIKSSRFITDGWDHYVLLINNDIIFRFPKTDEYRKIFLQEINFLQFIQDKINWVALPDYIYTSKDPLFWWYKSLWGKNLLEILKTEKSTINKRNIGYCIGHFLYSLHKITITSIEAREYWVEWSKNRHQKNIECFQENIKILKSTFSGSDLKKIYTFIEKYKNIIWFKFECRLIHGDLHKKHILVWKDKPGIIDFWDRAWDDPAIDFAWVMLEQEILEEILGIYPVGKDKYFLQRAFAYKVSAPLRHIIDFYRWKSPIWITLSPEDEIRKFQKYTKHNYFNFFK